ncbi:MAG: CHASE3 domain-containing protein [Deltaproteobacteria bacterium]|nr:CHASE3 domain-containing protein [Deltaproteobacteria bacterium]
MTIKIGKKMALGYGVLIGFLVAFGIVVMMNLTGIVKQFSFVVEHDAPVIANARELSKLVVDMETGQRGFIITGKDEFLEPYTEGIKKFKKLLQKEKELVSDNPGQVKALEKIEGLVNQWQQKAAGPEIALGRKIAENLVDADYLQELLANGTGKEIMDNIRLVLNEMTVDFRRTGNEQGENLSVSMAKDMVDLETGQRGFVITGKEVFLEPYVAGREQLKKHTNKLRSFLTGDEKKLILLARAESLANDWFEKAATPEINARQVMNRHPETLKGASALLSAGTGKKILDQIREEFEKFLEIEEGLTRNRFANASGNARRIRIITLLFLVISIIFGSTVAFFISRGIINSIRELSDAVGLVAKGDLPPEVKVRTKDEIGQLAVDFNQMVEDLRRMDERHRHAETKLASAHSQLKNVMDAARQVSIIATDPKGLIKVFNTGAEKMLDYSAEEVIEKQTPAIFHLESEVSAHGRKLTEELGRPIEGFEVFVAKARKGDYEEREWTYVKKRWNQTYRNFIHYCCI